MSDIQLPAGEAREDEREIEKVADRVQSSEAQPALVREAATVPLAAADPDTGQSKALVGPDGRPAQMRGEVITTLDAEQARHEEMRKFKPCLSCGHSFFPRPKSDLWANREAHVSMGKRLAIIAPLETSAEYMGCTAHKLWVHVSQTCPPDKLFMHSYRKGWLAAFKEFVARRRLGGFA